MNTARSDFSESVLPFAAPRPLLGDSEAMQEVYRLIERVGPTEASVLLTGESGSGKELAAQSIHDGHEVEQVRSREVARPVHHVGVGVGGHLSRLEEPDRETLCDSHIRD